MAATSQVKLFIRGLLVLYSAGGMFWVVSGCAGQSARGNDYTEVIQDGTPKGVLKDGGVGAEEKASPVRNGVVIVENEWGKGLGCIPLLVSELDGQIYPSFTDADGRTELPFPLKKGAEVFVQFVHLDPRQGEPGAAACQAPKLLLTDRLVGYSIPSRKRHSVPSDSDPLRITLKQARPLHFAIEVDLVRGGGVPSFTFNGWHSGRTWFGTLSEHERPSVSLSGILEQAPAEDGVVCLAYYNGQYVCCATQATDRKAPLVLSFAPMESRQSVEIYGQCKPGRAGSYRSVSLINTEDRSLWQLHAEVEPTAEFQRFYSNLRQQSCSLPVGDYWIFSSPMDELSVYGRVGQAQAVETPPSSTPRLTLRPGMKRVDFVEPAK